MLKQSFAFLLATTLLLSGCGTLTAPDQKTKLIVTTFVPYYVFTQNLVGENATVINIINNSQEPHDYQLKPSDIVTLQKADLIIRNGLGLDDWVKEAAEKSGTKATIFTASDYITPLAPQSTLELDPNSSGPKDADTNFDPHIWVSPKNVLQILPHIADAISNIDSDHQDTYQKHLQQYSDRITMLDKTIAKQLQPFANKEFISFHEAFQYFARDYGLVSAIAIEAYPGKEPTPRYLQALIEKIKASNIKTIFSEPQFSPRIIEVLAQDLHLQVFSLDPLETGTYTADLYEKNTLSNVSNIVQAFSL